MHKQLSSSTLLKLHWHHKQTREKLLFLQPNAKNKEILFVIPPFYVLLYSLSLSLYRAICTFSNRSIFYIANLCNTNRRGALHIDIFIFIRQKYLHYNINLCKSWRFLELFRKLRRYLRCKQQTVDTNLKHKYISYITENTFDDRSHDFCIISTLIYRHK